VNQTEINTTLINTIFTNYSCRRELLLVWVSFLNFIQIYSF